MCEPKAERDRSDDREMMCVVLKIAALICVVGIAIGWWLAKMELRDEAQERLGTQTQKESAPMKMEEIVRELAQVGKELRDDQTNAAAERIGMLRGRLGQAQIAAAAAAEETPSQGFTPIRELGVSKEEIERGLLNIVRALTGKTGLADDTGVAPGPNPALAALLAERLRVRVRTEGIREPEISASAR